MNAPEPDRPVVAILGGGPAGLAAAWALSDLPLDVVVIEARDTPGGLDCSEDAGDGFVFDHGVHGFFASRPETEPVLEDLRRIMAGRFVEVHKKTSLLFRGRYLSYPLGMRDLFRALDPWTALVAGVTFVRARLALRLGRGGDDRTFRGWVTNRYGSKLCSIYFAPYSEKTWGISADELSSGQLGRRVTTVSLWAVLSGACKKLIGLAAARRGEYPQQPPSFIYGVRGSASLVESLLEQVDNDSVRILTSTVATSIEERDGRAAAVVLKGPGGEKRLTVDHVISTIPIGPFAALMRDWASAEEMQTAAARLRYRAMVIVNLRVRREHVLDAQWTYFPDQRIMFNRINEYKYFHEELAPPGHTGLGVEVTCDRDDDTWKSSDEELFRRVMVDLEPTGLIATGDVIGHSVMRIATAYPIGDIHADENMAAVHRFVEGSGNLHLAGRQAEFRYINTDEAIHSGRLAAARVAADLEGASSTSVPPALQ